MDKIFLGLDDEITDVVEKMRNTSDDDIVLVVPKGATLLQSAVNVRLLKKKSEDMDKKLSVVASDAVSKQLASQAGLNIHASINTLSGGAVREKPKPPVTESENVVNEESISTQSGEHINVRHYNASATEALKKLSKDKEEIEAPNEPESTESDDATEPVTAEVETPKIIEDVGNEDVDEGEASMVLGKEFQEAPPPTYHHSKLKPVHKPTHIPKWIPTVIATLIVLILVGSGVAIVAIPKATVMVSVPSEQLSKKVNVVVDTTLTASTADKLAGLTHEQTIEQSGSATATGKKQVGDKAKGTVTVSNSWSSDAITIAKDVVMTSSDKKLQFRVTSATSVPGVTISKKNGQLVETPGKADVAVIADQAGDQYNLSPTTFSIAGYTSDVSGTNSKAFSGGTSRELTVVADKDIENAKADASSKLQSSAKDLLTSELSADETLIDQKVTNINYADPDHKAGDEATTVAVKASGKAIVYTVKNNDIETFLAGKFSEGLSEVKSAVLPPVANIHWTVTSAKETTLNLESEIEAQIIAKFDVNSLRKQLKFHKESYVVTKLTKDLEAKTVEVTISPAGWKYMPILTGNIAIEVKD